MSCFVAFTATMNLRLAYVAILAVIGVSSASARDGLLPREILSLGGEGIRYALLVDKEAEKLFVYEVLPGEPPRLVRAWNATTGQGQGDKRVSGDNRTPEGIYFFTEILEDEALPPLYGVRALVLDYPNLFDRRRGKTGYGIWLHGTDELVRPLVSNQTRGCVVLSNRDVIEISRYVELQRTPIIVSDRVDLLPARAWRAERNQIFEFLEGWRRAWVEKDQRGYGTSYAAEFAADGLDRAGWLQRKAEVAQVSTELAVDLYQKTILRRGDEAIATFGQLYRSNLVSDYGEKTLWLELRAGRWRIVAERWRSVPAPPAVAILLNPTPTPAPPPVALARQASPELPLPAEPAPRAIDRASASAVMLASLAAVAPAESRPSQDPVPPLPIPASPPGDVPLALSHFLAESDPEEVLVSFQLESQRPGEALLRGQLVVVVRFSAAGGDRFLAWPFGARLVAGQPMPPIRGDSYAVRRFKIVNARLRGVPRDARLAEVVVHVYDRAGREILRRSYGG